MVNARAIFSNRSGYLDDARSAAYHGTPDLQFIMNQIGEYQIERALTPDQTFLALAPGGRNVVLKILDSECLQRGQLHPNIHARLSRVRELAHCGVANLLGVERVESRIFAVWEYVAGEPLDRYVAAMQSPEQMTALAREIILAVQSLHALGIVHGAIHAGNIIIDDRKQVRLTHVSPLLYDDPAADDHDLTTMLTAVAAQRGWGDCELTRALADATSLTQLRIRLSAGKGDAGSPAQPVDDDARGLRRRAILGAVAAAVVGLGIAFAVIKWIS
jgi:hypothetical protein